jgi:heterodisulfide reductase subunit A
MLDITGPTNSSVIRLSDGKPANSVAYVLCAGSRDINKGVPYCSSICCLYSIKQALILKKFMDIQDVWIHYIDIRTPGRRYEEFYKNAQMEGVKFVKGKVSEIIPEGNQLMILSEDMLANRLLETKVDIAVLCPPVINSPETLKLAEILKTPVDEDTFVLEKHPKLDPIATKKEGIYACGMVSGPKDIQSTVAESEGAAMKAINFIRTKVEIKPEKAYIKDILACTGCGECINICPFNAIDLLDEKAKINEIVCTGCGACIPICPVDIIDLQGYTEDQLLSQVKAMLTESKARRKILAFLETETAYVAADIAGISRLSYPTSIRILPIPSTSRLKLGHILYAFAHGADGVMLLEAPEEVGALGKAHAIAEERAENYMLSLEDYGIDSLRLWFSKIYVPDWRKLSIIFTNFDEMIKDENPIDPEIRKNLLSLSNSD